MRILTSAGFVRANQFHSNQRDVVTHMVDEIFGRFVLRAGGQFVVIHLPLMFPMHTEDECLPHSFVNRSADPQSWPAWNFWRSAIVSSSFAPALRLLAQLDDKRDRQYPLVSS